MKLRLLARLPHTDAHANLHRSLQEPVQLWRLLTLYQPLAVWLLAELGIPFLREVWEPTQKIVFESTSAGRKPDLFLTYLRTIKELGIVVEGFWQSDMMLNDFINIGECYLVFYRNAIYCIVFAYFQYVLFFGIHHLHYYNFII